MQVGLGCSGGGCCHLSEKWSVEGNEPISWKTIHHLLSTCLNPKKPATQLVHVVVKWPKHLNTPMGRIQQRYCLPKAEGVIIVAAICVQPFKNHCIGLRGLVKTHLNHLFLLPSATSLNKSLESCPEFKPIRSVIQGKGANKPLCISALTGSALSYWCQKPDTTTGWSRMDFSLFHSFAVNTICWKTAPASGKTEYRNTFNTQCTFFFLLSYIHTLLQLCIK